MFSLAAVSSIVRNALSRRRRWALSISCQVQSIMRLEKPEVVLFRERPGPGFGRCPVTDSVANMEPVAFICFPDPGAKATNRCIDQGKS